MIKVADFLSNLVRRVLPDPLVIAIILTMASVVLALTVGRTSPVDLTRYWGEGFWGLLAFTMQVVLIILTGFLLARTPIVNKLLDRLASIPSGPTSAIFVTAIATGIASWLQWGFGLIFGTLIAQKIAAKVQSAHYPLIIATAYSAFVIYGMGLSATIPLQINTPGHFLENEIGLIPLSETIFHPVILISAIFTTLTVPAFLSMLHPKEASKIIPMDPKLIDTVRAEKIDREHMSISDRMNNSKVFGWFVGLFGVAYSVLYFIDGGSLNLDAVNFIFFMLAFLLFGTPANFLAALKDGVATVGGVIAQYPFYAGIMAILTGSGLVVTFSDLFTRFSSDSTLPIWSFITAGITNVFIPSGGGQWAVQGPVMMEAAHETGASVAATAMAVSIGDQWTNMLQPMFLLPVLALSKLKLTDVMGYTIMVLFYTGVVFTITTYLHGLALL